MPELTTLLAYTVACAAIVIVPGPTVTVIIANALRHGAGAGLMNVAGTQVGLLVLIGALALGLGFVAEQMAWLFEIVRWLGAAYLIWLGIQMWRSRGELGEASAAPSRSGLFWQGFLVILSNPKALVFFGAFIPQFVDPAANVMAQTILFGLIFMAVATVLDSLYALAAGSAGGALTQSRVRLVEKASGSFLIAGGVWLALSRTR
ncbi:MAG: LysE family translocator [Pseudomonadota bacterium]